jgi:hypothetical protein
MASLNWAPDPDDLRILNYQPRLKETVLAASFVIEP